MMMTNRKFLFLVILVVFSLLPSPVGGAQALPSEPAAGFAEDQNGGAKAREEDDAYNSAQESLNNEEFANAISAFDSVIKMRGRKADAATYWKAYALNKVGDKAQALTLIAGLRKGYPQ